MRPMKVQVKNPLRHLTEHPNCNLGTLYCRMINCPELSKQQPKEKIRQWQSELVGWFIIVQFPVNHYNPKYNQLRTTLKQIAWESKGAAITDFPYQQLPQSYRIRQIIHICCLEGQAVGISIDWGTTLTLRWSLLNILLAISNFATTCQLTLTRVLVEYLLITLYCDGPPTDILLTY